MPDRKTPQRPDRQRTDRFEVMASMDAQRGRRQPVCLAGAGVDIRFDMADNPYFTRAHGSDATNPRRIAVARNVNESPLVRLVYDKQLDAVAGRAGFLFRARWEKLLAGSPSPSDIREHVDGARAADVFTESRMQASRDLAAAAAAMTPTHYAVVRFVCGEGRPLRDLRVALACRRGRELDVLRDALERLADVWGLKPANAARRTDR